MKDQEAAPTGPQAVVKSIEQRSGKSWPTWLRVPEVSVLLAILAISFAVWGFIELADEVAEGETSRVDTALLLALRTPGDHSDPLGPGWVEEIGRDFSALGGTAVIALTVLGVIGYLLLASKPHMAMVVVLAALGALALSTVLKSTIDRSRPDLVPHGSIVYTKSFPSGHSMQSSATYLTLAALLAGAQRHRKMKIYLISVAVTVTVLVGASRVYLGVHWPTDVLAGWTAGAAWALLCWLLARWLQAKGQVETDADLTE